mgnify:CR=1 FL=1
MLLLATVMTSFGILIAARQKSMEGFQMMMHFLLMPMFFLSGAFFPLRGVPPWMAWLSDASIRSPTRSRFIAPERSGVRAACRPDCSRRSQASSDRDGRHDHARARGGVHRAAAVAVRAAGVTT